MEHDERRVFQRHQITSGKVKYRTKDGTKSIVQLSDLSKNSVRFEMTGKLANGDLIDIEIMIPSHETIILNGRVVWTSQARDSHPPYAAVQFIPFSTEEFRTTPAFKQLDLILTKLEQ